MQIIKPSIYLEDTLDYKRVLKKIERAARTCYKSEDKIEEGSAEKLIRSCIKRGHESILEHEIISIRIICSRGVTHELVRHRLASYSQESTRYVNYGKRELQFIEPWWFADETKNKDGFIKTCKDAEYNYLLMLEEGHSPQAARDALPNSTKTEIFMTANIREWRHILKIRMDIAAHPDIQLLMRKVYNILTASMPVFFEDIY